MPISPFHRGSRRQGLLESAAQRQQRGDYVRVQGSVRDQYQGTNAFGATLSVPRVTATNVTRILREDAIAPTLKSFDTPTAKRVFS
jgi:hypothetical protein